MDNFIDLAPKHTRRGNLQPRILNLRNPQMVPFRVPKGPGNDDKIEIKVRAYRLLMTGDKP